MFSKDHKCYGVLEDEVPEMPMERDLARACYDQDSARANHRVVRNYYFRADECPVCMPNGGMHDKEQLLSKRDAMATFKKILTPIQFSNYVTFGAFVLRDSESTVILKHGISGNLLRSSSQVGRWTPWCCHSSSIKSVEQCNVEQYLAIKADSAKFWDKANCWGGLHGVVL